MNSHLKSSLPGKKEERKSREKSFLQKLNFNRAISEPPSASKNAVLPVTEDFNDEANSSSEDLNNRNNAKGGHTGPLGALEPVDEEDPKRLSKDEGGTGARRYLAGKKSG
jgi:hypothetical protein